MQLNSMLSSLLAPTNGGSQACPTPQPKRATQGADGAEKVEASGVMAQISDVAKQMFAQMKRDGVAAESFDLHLDLRQLGIKVGAMGSRSIEGHSLAIDLHVEAEQGKAKTDDGEVNFQSLDVSFSLEETWVKATEQAQQDDRQSASKPADKGGLIENLKKLISMLDKSNGESDQIEGLGALLAQIGKALEQMAKRLDGAKNDAKPGDDNSVQQLQGFQLQEDVHANYWGQLAMRNCFRQAYNGGAVHGGTCTAVGGMNGFGEPNTSLH